MERSAWRPLSSQAATSRFTTQRFHQRSAQSDKRSNGFAEDLRSNRLCPGRRLKGREDFEAGDLLEVAKVAREHGVALFDRSGGDDQIV